MDALTTIHPELLILSSHQLSVLMPYFIVSGGIALTILLSVLRIIQPKWPVFLAALVTCGLGVASSMELMAEESTVLFNGMLVADAYSHFFNIIFLLAAAFTICSSLRYLDKEKLQHPEYYILLLFATLGMMLMTASLDLIVFFIALELMSLAVYVLVGFRRADRRSNEASLKYFLLGSAASAILLYGVAMLYGATGSTEVRSILALVQKDAANVTPVFILGLVMVLFGFLFKVAAIPFHMWMPDVYEGAPVPITGFMTTGLKAAAFGAFVRIFVSLGYVKGLPDFLTSHFHDVLWICAVLTMAIGNLVALTQTNLKRMLAYSSIAHTGYLLVGILAGPQSELGMAPVVMYVVSYAIMNLGAFTVLTALSARDDSGLGLHDLSGLAQRHPWLAFALAVFLFSMAGIPPTAGFAAKYLIFYSAIQAHEVALVIIAVLCSAVSVYYYLRVLVFMYMRDPVGSPSVLRVPVWSSFAVASMVVLTIHIGVLPAKIVEVTKKVVLGI